MNGLFTTFFPGNCRICGAPLVTISRLPVCDTCLAGIRAIDEPVCAVCGERLISHHLLDGAGEGTCGQCRLETPPFEKAAAYGSYDGGLRELIHLLKYQRVRPAAAVLGRMLADAIAAGLIPHFGDKLPLVVPVPLHRAKQGQRGFNQSELIAAEALKHVPVHLSMCAAALVRVRATESQTGLTRQQRRANMKGAFRVARAELIAGCDILLVDDVFTTGTTISECARVLRRAGATRVFAATVARVLKAEAAGALPEEDFENEPLSMTAQA